MDRLDAEAEARSLVPRGAGVPIQSTRLDDRELPVVDESKIGRPVGQFAAVECGDGAGDGTPRACLLYTSDAADE